MVKGCIKVYHVEIPDGNKTINYWYAKNFQETFETFVVKSICVHTFLNYIFTYFLSTSDMCTLEIDDGGFDIFSSDKHSILYNFIETAASFGVISSPLRY